MTESRDEVPALPAGPLAGWLVAMRTALDDGTSTEVSCDGCTACCTSRQFVHIGPDESDSLASIPAALLFPAPLLPRGHKVLGYDEHGRCPMLRDDQCSIYANRPRACRVYDCRIFAATGIAAPADKPAIAHRSSRWRFTLDDPVDAARDALDAAAAFISANEALLFDGPITTTQIAVAVVKAAAAFSDGHEPGLAQIREALVDLPTRSAPRAGPGGRTTRPRRPS
jgi:Fe-S-cluster containining protein